MSLRTLFFAPVTVTSPARRLLPWIRSRSTPRCYEPRDRSARRTRLVRVWGEFVSAYDLRTRPRLSSWSSSPGSTPVPATTAPPGSSTTAGSPRPTSASRPTRTSTRPTPPWVWRSHSASSRARSRASCSASRTTSSTSAPTSATPSFPNPSAAASDHAGVRRTTRGMVRRVQRAGGAAAVLRPPRRDSGRRPAPPGADDHPTGRTHHLGGDRGTRHEMNPDAARYLNRLSDLLFILARVANGPTGDVLWKPGGTKSEDD